MSANLRIVPRNFHDEATVTASEAASGFPAANTQNTARDQAWRSSTTGTVTIDGTFSRARTVSFFGMFRHRNHGGSIRVELFSDAAWTTLATGGDTGTVAINKIVGGAGDTAYQWGDDPYGIGQYDPLIAESPYWYWFSPVAVQSYRVTLSAHSTTFWSGAYWQISRLWLGNHFEPAVNPDFGSALGWMDNTDRNRTRGGSLRTNLGARWRTAKMDLQSLNEDESPVWLDIMAWAETGKDVVASLFPLDGTRRERDNIFMAKFSALDTIGRQVNRLTKTLQLEEM